jgi:hypothetical protein
MMAELQDDIVFEVLAELKACSTESDGIYAATPMERDDSNPASEHGRTLLVATRKQEDLRGLFAL